jgi:hypothetical protein
MEHFRKTQSQSGGGDSESDSSRSRRTVEGSGAAGGQNIHC